MKIFRTRRSASGEATARSPLRRTSDAEAEHYSQVVAPAAAASHGLCTELQTAIMHRTGEATPERILEALRVPSDPMLLTYTQKYRTDLELTCLSYGIDPTTGERQR